MANLMIKKDVSTLKQPLYELVVPSQNSVTPGCLVYQNDSLYYVDSNGNLVALSTGGGAPTNASYVVMSANGSLTAERILTQGAGITIVDGGANGPVTISNSSPASSVTLTSAGGTVSLVNDGTGPALAVKGLTSGVGMNLVDSGNDVTIVNTSPASSVTLASAGGVSLVSGGVGPGLAVKGLVAGTNVSLVAGMNSVTIDVTVPPSAAWATWPAVVQLEGNISNTTVMNARYLQTGTTTGSVVQFFANLMGDVTGVGLVDVILTLPSVQDPDLADGSPVGPVNINPLAATGGYTRVFIDGVFCVGVQFDSTGANLGQLFSISGSYTIV